MLLYLFMALGISFTCSVLEAVLLSTPMSFITMKEQEGGGKSALLLKKYKQNIDKPISAILSLNTIAHTIGAAGVGAEAVKIFGQAYFGIISAILTILILVLRIGGDWRFFRRRSYGYSSTSAILWCYCPS